MTVLRLTLLGAFALAGPDGAPIRIETRKARAVLALLVMARGRPMPRERLAGMVWSRGETRQALASLSQALYSLRKALGGAADTVLLADVDSVSVDMSRLQVDALALEEAAAEGSDAARRRCLDLYRGPFLDDIAIDTEHAYAEWRAAEQARLEEIARQAGAALMVSWEAQHEAADPAVVDRLLAIDPYAEAAIRVRMRNLAGDGRSAAALEVADRFTERLSADLGIAPSQAFVDLVGALRRGEIAPAYPPSAEVTRGASRSSMRSLAAALAAGLAVALGLVAFNSLRPDPPDGDGMRLLVRPFEAGEGLDAALAEGFGDDLATELVRRAALEVMARESGRLIADSGVPESGASHVLQGRLRRDGDRLVLNLWITNVGTGREVWAGRFSGGARAPRVFRDRVVAQVADRIDLALAPAPEAPLPLPAEAVPEYLRALSALHAGTPEANADALAALAPLHAAHPDAPGPAGALAVAYERLAFEADAYARAADRHWREGYLGLKAVLARAELDHPDLLAARARLALRRLDHAAAEAAARQALRLEPAHVDSLAVLAETQALTGATAEAVATAERVIALAPATPAGGYTALALARFAEGDLAAAEAAAVTALEYARTPSLRLRALVAAITGLRAPGQKAHAAFAELVAAADSRPFAAWRVGDLTYDNPRAATWRRPTGSDAAALITFAVPDLEARFRTGLLAADPQSKPDPTAPAERPMTGAAIRQTLFGQEILGMSSWLVQQGWRQVRTERGALFQVGAFGPLAGAQEGTSHVVGDRLCDRWEWRGTPLESCQRLVFSGAAGRYALIGETGRFDFQLPR